MIRTHYLLLGLAGILLLTSGCATMGTAFKYGGALAGYQELSDMGSSMEKASREFNSEEKYYIGRTVAVTLLADAPWLKGKDLTRYVNQIGQTLVLASEKPELFTGYHFAVLDAPDKINAFACPGGFVFISLGMVRKCQNEDELAGVIAHEIAHVVADHPIQAIQASHQREAVASLVKFGIRQAAENQGIGELTGLFDNVVKDVVKAVAQGYSRDKESQADLMAVDLLKQAGYSPLALAEVLGRMDSKSCHHGDPKIRAKDVQTKVQQKAYTSDILAARTKRYEQVVK